MNRQDAEVAKSVGWEEPSQEVDELAHTRRPLPHKCLAVLAPWRFIPPKAFTYLRTTPKPGAPKASQIRDLIVLDLVEQGAMTDFQNFGSARAIPLGLLQRASNQDFLDDAHGLLDA